MDEVGAVEVVMGISCCSASSGMAEDLSLVSATRISQSGIIETRSGIGRVSTFLMTQLVGLVARDLISPRMETCVLHSEPVQWNDEVKRMINLTVHFPIAP